MIRELTDFIIDIIVTRVVRRQRSSPRGNQIWIATNSRSLGQNVLYNVKGLVPKNTHVKYEILSLTVHKLWPRLKFLKSRLTSRSRSLGKKLWYDVKILVPRNTHAIYKSPASHGSWFMTKVKVMKSRLTSRSRSLGKKITVWREMSCFKEYTCEIWKPCLSWFIS